MIKLLTVIGARPQFIKAAAISRVIKETYQDQLEEVIVHTGQHYDPKMSEVFFEELKVPREKYNLQIGSAGHAVQTASMMIKLDEIVAKEQPNAILLYGDTNSTLAACLVGIKLHLPIIHIEGGVRSYNKKFPEEVNRLICDHMSSLVFVPSDDGMRGLKKEGFELDEISGKATADQPAVYRCGDIMYDNTLYFKELADERANDFFESNQLPAEQYILGTLHRPSNVDDPQALKRILKAFNSIIATEDRAIILPLHPRTRSKIDAEPELEALLANPQLFVIEPASFIEMTILESHADLVITDSGGVQKEAFFHEKPCAIMLEETPWVELIATNAAFLVGNDDQLICSKVHELLNPTAPLSFPPLYGKGDAAKFICEKIITHLRP